MARCNFCFRRRNLTHFIVHRKIKDGWETINPSLYLCKKCGNKLFGEGWDKWEETHIVSCAEKK